MERKIKTKIIFEISVPLSLTDRISRKKFTKVIEELNIINQLLNVSRIFHPQTRGYTLFKHAWKIHQDNFLDHRSINRLKINELYKACSLINRKRSASSPNIWKFKEHTSKQPMDERQHYMGNLKVIEFEYTSKHNTSKVLKRQYMKNQCLLGNL